MSIKMDRIETSGFRGGGIGGVACASLCEALPSSNGERKEEKEEKEQQQQQQQQENWCSSSSTSSIGRNSDLSGRTSDGEDGEDNEVQSAYNGPLDMMNSLEEVLPIRRGISKFYNGKSKSFTSLADASSTSSIKDIGKHENAYSRRRRNLLIWDKNRSSPLRSNGCGISKKPIISNRSTLALAFAMSSSESFSSTSDESNSRSPPPLPPLHPKSGASSSRSYSLADLRQCRTEVTSNVQHSFVS